MDKEAVDHMLMYWMWLGLVAGIIVLFAIHYFVRASIRRLKRLDEALRTEAEQFEAHRKKELWDIEQAKKLDDLD
jgi:uncharacterized membrane-anchored protein YhcB (DUF1043 family)